MTETPAPTLFRIKGRWLLLARSIWIILAIVSISFFIAAIINMYGWSKPCNTYDLPDQADCFKKEQTYAAFGITKDFLGIYYPLGVVVEILPWLLAGIVIFWKKSDEPFGLLFSLMLMVTGTFNLDVGVPEGATSTFPVLAPFWTGMAFIGGLLLVLWYCFPNGRFVPRWLCWAAIIWGILQTGATFFPDSSFSYYNWPYPLPDGITDLLALSIIYSLVHRYRHTSDQIQIQQIKWVVLSGSLLAVMKIIPSLLFNPYVIPWNDNVAVIAQMTYLPLFYLSVMFVGVSLGFSILRYRLWDIDFIINRSLVCP